MRDGPQVLIEDADKWEGDTGGCAEPEEGVILAVRNHSIKFLVEGAEVGLLHSKHEYGR